MLKLNKDIFLFAACSWSLWIGVGCSSNNESTGLGGSLQVASLQRQTVVSSSNLSRSSHALHGSNQMLAASTDLPASSNHYSFAKIDGIKVTINEVRGADAASDNPLVTHTVAKEIELSDDPTKAIALNESVNWVVGNYSGVDLRLANSWKVKAYCKTQASGSNYTLVYTTAAGVATQACTTSSCDLPANYDYFAYGFLDDYYTQNGGDPNIATHYKFSLAAGTTPKVSLFFDATNTVACWDGSGWSSSEAVGVFRGPSPTRRPVLWPDGTAAFAVPVMPVLTYVTSDLNEATPKARTFFTSSTSSDLADPIVAANTQTVTILYKEDGTAITASARNLSGNGTSNPIDMDFDGFGSSTTGTGIDFFAAGWYYSGGSSAPELIRNRKFEGFSLPVSSHSTFPVTVKDGGGCGQTLTDHNGNNPSKACLGSGVSQTLYWREAS